MNIDREDCLSTAKELIGFLEKSPTCFHAVQSIADCLEQASHSFMREKSGSSQRADPTM